MPETPSFSDSADGRHRVRRRRRRSQSRPSSTGFGQLPADWVPPLVAVLLAALLLPIHWRGFPPTVGWVLSALSLAGGLAGVAVWGRIPRDLFRKPAAWLLAAGLLWTIVSSVRSPFPGPSATDLLRNLTGAGLFAYAAFVLDTPARRRHALVGTVVLAAAMALVDLLGYGGRWQEASGTHFDANALSLFGSHETVGTVLSLVLPVVAAFAFSEKTPERLRLLMVIATLVVGFAWISARCRSAWVGGTVGLVWALAAVAWMARREPRETRDKGGRWARWLASPLPLVVALWIFLVATGGLSGALLDRAQKVFQGVGPSLLSRLDLWKAAGAMVSERPWTGWGLGGYLVQQGNWSHRGLAPWQVLEGGGDLSNVAHNYLIHWAADTGWVGVWLLLGAVAVLLCSMAPDSERAGDRSDRVLQTGLMGTLVGAVVTSMGSPAFHIAFVWSLLALLLGLAFGAGLGAAKPGNRALAAALVVVSALVALGVAGVRRWKDRPVGPRGVWELNVDAPGGVLPGQVVEWQASYKDAAGVAQSTFPGTEWDAPWLVEVRGEGVSEERRQVAPLDAKDIEIRGKRKGSEFGASVMRAKVPSRDGGNGRYEIWTNARYRDDEGREYEAMSVLAVEPDPSRSTPATKR